MSTQQGTTVMTQGRIVWTSGNLFKGQGKTEYNSQTPKLNAQGEQQREYGFGLAIPKSALSQVGPDQPGAIWTAIHEEAYKLFPNRQLPPDFAMKYKDGDGVDHKGVSFTQRTGYAGHLVFSLSTTIPIKYFKFENNQNIMINEGIKCGDYVNVQVNVKSHAAIGQGKAGLYLNPYAVQFLGFGEEIINTPSGDQIFGATVPGMPAGASATPIASPGQIVPPSQAPGAQQAPQPGAPLLGPALPPQAGAPMPTPNYGVIPQAQQPQAAAPASLPGPPATARAINPGPPQPDYNAPMPEHQQPGAPAGMPSVPS